MILRRVFGRTLLAAAKSEASASGAAAASTVRTAHNPLEEFFEADRNPEEEKPVIYGVYFESLVFKILFVFYTRLCLLIIF